MNNEQNPSTVKPTAFMVSNDHLADYFSPKSFDKSYNQYDQLRISLIFRMDSYKYSHPFAYERDVGIEGMTSYGTARVDPKTVIIPAGMQRLVKKYLIEQITMQDVDAAEAFAIAHFGRKLFDRKAWEKVVNEYNGYLPLIIRAVPEGLKIFGGMPVYTITVLDPDLWWMSAGFEMLVQRGIWYPTTIATNDYYTKKSLKELYLSSGADLNMLAFALHDFGGRGASSGETAEIGSCYHTFCFQGSDTVEGILNANFYYKCDMAAFSVYATEHSIQCSFGSSREDMVRYIRHQLKMAKQLGVSIMSIVLDGFDVYREVDICCNDLRDEIIASGIKVVFRPDSGNMFEIAAIILDKQEKAFGYTRTSTGHKRIKHVGLIQGDGINHKSAIELVSFIVSLGYSADCIVLGSGGALLQKVDRDKYKFAQKACALLINDGVTPKYWKDIAKDPITDPGKKSLEGVLTVGREIATGDLKTLRVDLGELTAEYEDVMILVYYLGQLFNETTLAEARARIDA